MIISYIASAQSGHLLVIGGGSEKDSPGAWNKAPYTWAVEQSANKRVAVIAYGSASDWLPDYFVNQCGAIQAKNFNISNASVANAQATHDSLLSYDVIFLKGGDQYNYYSTYKGTLTEQAIVSVFNRGGVICGTSAGLAVLGGVDYIAANASADPLDCLQDPDHADITLADDFLPFIPGVLFDSHFAERGRFGRLLPFLANWYLHQGEVLTGIGVDDQTAFAIGSGGTGTCYGSGTVGIYLPGQSSPFSGLPGKLEAAGLKVIQLPEGGSYDFISGQVSGMNPDFGTRLEEETGHYTVLASGGNSLSMNEDMLTHLVQQTGSAADPILLLTGTETSTAESFRSFLMGAGAQTVYVERATLAYINQTELGEKINECNKFVFLENNENELLAFLENGSNGPLLYYKMRRPASVTAFVGSNSRLAGRTMVNGVLEEGASYYGNLSLAPGMALLAASVIMPASWSNSNLYENTATGVPWAMVKDSLKYGIWLNEGNFMKYYPVGDHIRLAGYGTSPVILLGNSATRAGLVEKTVYGEPDDIPRNIGYFNAMELSLLQGSVEVPLGTELVTSSEKLPGLTDAPGVLYPNPVKDLLHYRGSLRGHPELYDLSGRKIMHGPFMEYRGSWNIGQLEPGLYIFRLPDTHQPVTYNQIIVRQ